MGDGITDDTVAVQAAIDFATNSVDATIPGGVGTGHGVWGKREVYFPKGRYKLGELIVNQSLGLSFAGESTFSTSLEYHSDSGTFMTFFGHLFTVIKDLIILHVPTGDFTTWTNTCFRYFSVGFGGGSHFKCENIYVEGFNVVKYLDSIGNNDNFFTTNCRFRDFNTYWYNPEAKTSVVHKWEKCGFTHGNVAVWDVTTGGTYRMSNIDCVHRGDVLVLRPAAGFWAPDANFIFDSMRLEWMVDHDETTVRTRLLNCLGSDITANVKFTSVGISGGHPHGARPNKFITHNGRVNVYFDNCAFTDVAGGSPPPDMEVHRGLSNQGTLVGDLGDEKIIFEAGIAIKPQDITIISAPGDENNPHPTIKYNNCRNVLDQSIHGQFIRGQRSVYDNVVRLNGDGNNRLFAAAPIDLVLPFNGNKTIINSIYFYLQSITGDSDKVIPIYSDAAKTQLFGSLAIKGGGKVNRGYLLRDLPNNILSDGLYFSMSNPDSTASQGYIIVNYSNYGSSGNSHPGYVNVKDSLI
ncbi:MAG: hypothetical protein ACRDE7_00005, partial [Sphingobacterium sp.]